MKVDLKNRFVQFVTQNYLERIANFESNEELGWDVHKLIHTFEVVNVAEKLVRLTKPSLPKKLQQQVINAALLHDVGRCYEFKQGKHLRGSDHGKIGATLIRKIFPKEKLLIETTKLHNKLPSEKDPPWAYPVLGYVRDADILGNLYYQVRHMDLFLSHIGKGILKQNNGLQISPEHALCVKSRCIIPSQDYRCANFLNMLLNQLSWVFILHTKAAYRMAKKEKLFETERDVILEQVIPVLNGTQKEKDQAQTEIMKIFSDSLFKEVYQAHGV